ncbi:MAG: alkaline phosphatase [Petroclostridium sp.]|jgi:alkaline phosphatase|nr:alkaline phosphatase [Petroclostridium sp.]
MTKNFKKILSAILCLALVLSVIASFSNAAIAEQATVKNVIILIPDGMSIAGTTLARWYKGGQPLALDEMACGLVRTYWANGAITDSAPGGTALAVGYKTDNKYVGVLPKSEGARPVATILEAAKLSGRATGLVATSEFMHATPADFSAHYPSRSNYDALSEQQVYNGIDVVLGAGSKYIEAANRKDKEDLVQVIKDLGYHYVTTPEAMKASTANKLWGMFSPTSLAYDFDRDPSKEPSLAEMTEKAIEVLSKNPNGFFLMVEGSKVDWAAHANDPVGVVSDVLAFDAAVKVALDFAKSNKNTVVISVTDHGNGGISIGDAGTTKGYDDAPLSMFIDPLKKAKLTGEGIEKKLNADRSNIKEVMAEYFGITDLTEDEIKKIKETKAGSMNYTVGPMISRRAHIGWTTGGHTGEDVVLYIYSPNGDRLTGVVDNTDIAKYMARMMGVNLDEATNKLFVSAGDAFRAKGATVTWDTTDVSNPVVVVTKDSDVLRLPVYKNIAELNGTIIKMNGVTVYNGIKTYVPQEAIDLIK